MSRMNSRTYIVRKSMRAPLSFFALRTPIRLPYFQTACFESNRMFAVVADLGGLWFDGFRLDAAWQEQMEVQLLARGGEVVDIEGDRVPLRLLVVRDVLVDPDDSHDLRDRCVEDRDLLVHDLRRLVCDSREDELDDLELLFRLGAMGLLREMRLEAAAGLFQREVQLRHDLVCGGHGLFRFGGVRHFRRTEVDEDDCGAEREARTAPLL